jgi:hypothetical protein
VRVPLRLAFALIAAALFLGGGGARAATFTNATAITIPAGAPSATQGDASPYPSNIAVTGVTGPVTRVAAVLNGFHHTYTQDVEVLLVGPGGQSSVLMSDVGTHEVAPAPVENLSFDDGGALIPCFTQDNVPLPQGVYEPTLYPTGDSQGNCISRLTATGFEAPAPAGPYTAGLAVFNGHDPNGVWHLYVRDADSDDTGAIDGGWTLLLTIAPPTLTSTPSIRGRPDVGRVLTAVSGTLTGGGAAAYGWSRCNASGKACAPIQGANRATYKPVGADRGHRLVVTETGVNSGGNSAPLTSRPTKPVGPALLSLAGTKLSQHVLGAKGVSATIKSNIAGTLTATGRASTVRFKTVKKKLRAGKKTTVRLKLSNSALGAIRGALASGEKLKAKLTLTVKDTNGGKAVRKLTVRLK